MNKYQTYKPSKIDWIGDIPTSWEIRKFRFLFIEKKSTQNLKLNSGSISFGKVIFKDDDGIPEERKETYQEVLKGEFLINPLNLNFDLKSLRIGLSEIDVVVSPGYIVLKLNEGLNKGYFNYLLRIFDTQQMKSLGNGVRQTISFKHLSSEELVLPPLSEQHQIVKFLDEKTELIDKLISTKERKITLLKEQRTSLINQVVTKGLNPNVKMKDSGVEWIGEIPEGWSVGKLKHICKENLKSLSNNTKPDYELDYVEISDVDSDGTIKNSTHYTFSESPSRCRRIVSKGDIILSTVRTYLRSIGLIENEVNDLICSTGFSVLTPNFGVYSKHLFYMVRTEWFISMVISKSEGVSYPSIQSEKLMNNLILVVPIDEQHQIVEFLDEKTKEIDDMVQLEQKKINLLKEYRQSLISEVVTGKIKVTKD